MADAEPGARSHVWKHEAQLDWMKRNFGYKWDRMSPLEIVTAFALYRVEWRKSPEYAELVEQHREDMNEERAARRAERAAAQGDGEGKKRGRPAKKAAAAKKTGRARKSTKAPAKATAASKRGRATRATRASAAAFE